MPDYQKELKDTVNLMEKKGLIKQASELKEISAAYFPTRPLVYKQQPADPNMPFASPGEMVTELTPMNPDMKEKMMLWVDQINPQRVDQLVKSSKDVNRLVAEGKVTIPQIETMFNEAKEQDNRAVLRFFLNEAKKSVEQYASKRLASISEQCLKKGYDTLSTRLKDMSDRLAAHPREKEHTIPSLEAIHEYMEDYKHYISKVEKLKGVYSDCARIIESFLGTFRAEIHKAGQDKKSEDTGAKKINKLVEEADIKIDRKIRDVERLLPAHPRNK